MTSMQLVTVYYLRFPRRYCNFHLLMEFFEINKEINNSIYHGKGWIKRLMTVTLKVNERDVLAFDLQLLTDVYF